MQATKESALGVPAFGSVAHKELALLSLLTGFLDWVLIFGKRHRCCAGHEPALRDPGDDTER